MTPRSYGQTQSPLTGYVGLSTIVLCIIVVIITLINNSEIEHAKYWPLYKPFCWFLVFLSMLAMEIFVFKTHKRNFDFQNGRNLDKNSWTRIIVRFLALFFCFVFSAIIVVPMSMLFPVFLPIYALSIPVILVLSLPYFFFSEKFAKLDGPVDEILILGQTMFPFISGKPQLEPGEQKEHLLNLFRGIVIKSYFIPFMTGSCSTFWGLWQNDILSLNKAITLQMQTGQMPLGLMAREIFLPLFNFTIVVDLTISLLGYLTSCRLLDTHFTSADPTPTGWIAALACYPPFNFLFHSVIFNNLCHEHSQSVHYINQPIFLIIVSFIVLILISIYSWSTVVFGLRFSNLTNRGIITSGPYSVVRHPAYASKNISWWFGLLPFILQSGVNCLLPICVLLVFNAFYVWRALTEERHLMREEDYQEYCRKVKWRFIPGLF